MRRDRSDLVGVQLDTKSDDATPGAPPRHRWVYHAASLWAVFFAAPHVWWALGWPFGFPGGPSNHRLWMASWWRYAYDIAVILSSILGAVVAIALARTAGHRAIRRPLRAMAWVACVLLGLRGVAGLVVDGTADPIWWPTFLAGGVLFGSVAWLSRPGLVE